MRFFNNCGSHKAIERLIKQGVGVREGSFVWLSGDATRTALSTALLSWMRTEAAGMRRPHGIDQVVVALACRNRQGAVLCSNSFGVVRPSVFYGSQGEAQIDAFLDDAELLRGADVSEVVVAMLSLGDIAYTLRAA